jgi:hypothetical protein
MVYVKGRLPCHHLLGLQAGSENHRSAPGIESNGLKISDQFDQCTLFAEGFQIDLVAGEGLEPPTPGL